MGTDVSFDMDNVIFQVIVSYAEAETTIGGLFFSSLIHELLIIQKGDLDVDADLEVPRKPLKIFTKLYTGAHVQDVGNDYDSPVTDNVEIGSPTAPFTILT